MWQASTLTNRICSLCSKWPWICNSWTTRCIKCNISRISSLSFLTPLPLCSLQLLHPSICHQRMQMERCPSKMKLIQVLGSLITLNSAKANSIILGREELCNMRILPTLRIVNFIQITSLRRQLVIMPLSRAWQLSLLQLTFWESISTLVSLRGRSLIS